jgi:hypothetical protein
MPFQMLHNPPSASLATLPARLPCYCACSCRARTLQQVTVFPYVEHTCVASTYGLQLRYASGGGSNVCFSLYLAPGTLLSQLCTVQQGWGLYNATIIGMGLQVGELMWLKLRDYCTAMVCACLTGRVCYLACSLESAGPARCPLENVAGHVWVEGHTRYCSTLPLKQPRAHESCF